MLYEAFIIENSLDDYFNRKLHFKVIIFTVVGLRGERKKFIYEIHTMTKSHSAPDGNGDDESESIIIAKKKQCEQKEGAKSLCL